MNCIDNKTKFVAAHLFVAERTKQKCYEFLKQVKDNCCNQILAKYYVKKFTGIDKRIIFVSDKFGNYTSAWKKLFNRITKLRFGVPIACKKFGLKHNNNSVERHNRELNRRFDALNVFQTHEGAQVTSTMSKILHNYVNPHSMLHGKTPAEKAELILPLGTNKLLGMIELARKAEMTTS